MENIVLITLNSNSITLQGYFQLLFSCIEKLLAFLNVQSLVLPAAEEAESIWTEKFGFTKIRPDQVNSNIRLNMPACLVCVPFSQPDMIIFSCAAAY